MTMSFFDRSKPFNRKKRFAGNFGLNFFVKINVTLFDHAKSLLTENFDKVLRSKAIDLFTSSKTSNFDLIFTKNAELLSNFTQFYQPRLQNIKIANQAKRFFEKFAPIDDKKVTVDPLTVIERPKLEEYSWLKVDFQK